MERAIVRNEDDDVSHTIQHAARCVVLRRARLSSTTSIMKRRAPWVGLFARQVMRDIAMHVSIAVAGAVTLFISIDSVEAVNRALSRATFADMVRLQLYNIPAVVQQFATVCVLIGTMTALAALLRRQEIVAMFSAGGAPSLILKPALLAGALMALGYAALTEWVAPIARAQVSAARRRLGLPIPPSDLLGSSRTWFHGEDRVYRVQTLEDPSGHVLGKVLMLRVENGRLLDRWDVERLAYDEGRWIGEGILARHFGGIEDTAIKTERIPSAPLRLEEEPEDFVRSIGAPERLHYVQLAAATRARERLGQPATAHRLELYRRHAYPASLLIAVVLAAAVALRLGRKPSISASLGVGALLGFVMWIMDEIALALGSSAAVPASVAAHMPLLFVACAAGIAWPFVMRWGMRIG
jgi:LPS export ABC transporter permease LptG